MRDRSTNQRQSCRLRRSAPVIAIVGATGAVGRELLAVLERRVKDSFGNLVQSIELLLYRPTGFSVMTGEANYYYTMLAHRAMRECNGGKLQSAVAI